MRGEGPWTDVLYRKNKNRRNQQVPQTTFYVTNLPDGVSRPLLWKAFQPYGVVKDAYVAKKRDARGNNFGFIRYEGVTNIKQVLEGMNTVRIYEAKLSVSLAKYDKDHKEFARVQDKEQHVPARQKPFAPPKMQYVPKSVQKSVTNNYTFSNAVTGNVGQKKTVVLGEKIDLYPDHCMWRSVIGDAKGVRALGKIRAMLTSGGYADNPICYIGGTKIMVVFKDKTSAVDFVENKAEMWEPLLSSVVLWKGQDFPFERLAWLRIHGVPIYLRESMVFNKIGELFGELVWKSEFTWAATDNSTSVCGVLTSSKKRIDEEVTLKWGEKEFNTWVTEEVTDWTKQIVEELTLAPSINEPVTMESVNGEEDEVEEGEIRSLERHSSPERDRPVAGDGCVPMEDEELTIPVGSSDGHAHVNSDTHAPGEEENFFGETQKPQCHHHDTDIQGLKAAWDYTNHNSKSGGDLDLGKI
ncbi:putative RNA recognition motif domain, nucleotide-binding alpha-beta plait domain superfamily [Helianthus debilis subsp. tardiflorus]